LSQRETRLGVKIIYQTLPTNRKQGKIYRARQPLGMKGEKYFRYYYKKIGGASAKI
jgi:hypothetical protein